MKSVLLTSLIVIGAGTASSDDGKKAFLEGNCNRCHALAAHDIEATVKSKNMQGPDLSNIGDTRDAEWIEKYVARDAGVEGKKHPSPARGSEEDRRAIAEWLASQRSER